MKKTETLNLRVSPEFKRRLIQEAARQKRSITNYLEVILTDIWTRPEVRGPEAEISKRSVPRKRESIDSD
jgi:hypothetical protein